MFPGARDPNAPEAYDLSNFTVLVVEDSTYMSTLMASMLKAFSVGDIMECHNAKEAIEVLTVTQARSKSRFITNVDIVLMDWLMPGGSGEELLNWIRCHSKDEIKFMPVVVISGFTTEKIVAAARDLGANETLVKPISAKGLASRICNVIEHPRPFVNIKTYFGPDRRRQEQVINFEDRRKTTAEEIQVVKKK
ncbi:MAG: response regulator [Pseudomonadota bacterium]